MFHQTVNDSRQGYLFNRQERKRKVSSTGIRVAGIDSMKISLAALLFSCSRWWYRRIYNKRTRSKGTSYRLSQYRAWETTLDWWMNGMKTMNRKHMKSSLIVKSSDRNFLLSDIVTVVSQCRRVCACCSSVDEDKVSATTKMTVVVENAIHLQTLMANLRKVNSVKSVERVIQ